MGLSESSLNQCLINRYDCTYKSRCCELIKMYFHCRTNHETAITESEDEITPSVSESPLNI